MLQLTNGSQDCKITWLTLVSYWDTLPRPRPLAAFDRAAQPRRGRAAVAPPPAAAPALRPAWAALALADRKTERSESAACTVCPGLPQVGGLPARALERDWKAGARGAKSALRETALLGGAAARRLFLPSTLLACRAAAPPLGACPGGGFY